MIRKSLRGPVPAAVLLASVSISTTAGATSEDDLPPRDESTPLIAGKLALVPKLHLEASILERAPVSLALPGPGHDGALEEIGRPRTRQLTLEGAGMFDPATSVQVDATAQARGRERWQAVGRVAFPGRHLRLIVGIGYEMPYANTGFVPDGSSSLVL
jgi:hypothetical protein